MYENIQRGTYLVGDKEMYFRSKWEVNTALYLDWLKSKGEIVDWVYEPYFYEFPIKHGTTRYLPDFLVTTKKGVEVWEVKGFMDSKSKTKLKRMAKYFPHIKIVIIDQAFMKSLKQYSKMLKFY